MAGYITDKSAERRRKRRLAVIEQYKIGYLEPYTFRKKSSTIVLSREGHTGKEVRG